MLNLVDLDSETRRWMLEELKHDIGEHKLYLSKRFTTAGERDYPELLRKAIQSHNEDWLAAQLRLAGRINEMEQSQRGGKTFEKRVPVNAAETLAEGEFNRFYLRGLCRRALDEGQAAVVVYRAKFVSQPRLESEQMIGKALDPQTLLRDLRENVGVDTALGLPPGPNSGLSGKLSAKAQEPVAVKE